MVHDLAQAVFASLCHQQIDRAWIVGGTSLALCARCTGVYAGAGLGLVALPFLRTRPSRTLVALHVAAVLQMIVLGTHLWPPDQPAWLRTVSGQLFVAGVIFLLWSPIRAAWLDRSATSKAASRVSPIVYGVTVTATLGALPLLIASGAPWAAVVIEATALGGLATLGLLATLAVVATIRLLCLSRSRPCR